VISSQRSPLFGPRLALARADRSWQSAKTLAASRQVSNVAWRESSPREYSRLALFQCRYGPPAILEHLGALLTSEGRAFVSPLASVFSNVRTDSAP
jgi:hypothetical protein